MQSIGTPTYKTTSTCHIPKYAALTNPVGQLVEIGARYEIKGRFCTGFNIADARYFMTAGHCISTTGATTCALDGSTSSNLLSGSCVVNFGYDACASGHVDTRVTSLQTLHAGEYSKIQRVIDHGPCDGGTGDYAVLQLTPDAAGYGSLPLSSERLSLSPHATPVLLVHHPDGHPKQYSTGAVTRIDLTTFVHSAHTRGGSSGAPVISLASNGVVGVHVRGDGTTQLYNSAIKIDAIVGTAHRKQAAWATPFYKSFGLKPLKSSGVGLGGGMTGPKKDPCC